MEDSIELSVDNKSSLDAILSKTQLLLLRLSSPKEDANFISNKLYKEIVYNNFLLYSPIIFEIVIVFAPVDNETTQTIIGNLLKQIPEYREDILNGFEYMVEDIIKQSKLLDVAK